MNRCIQQCLTANVHGYMHNRQTNSPVTFLTLFVIIELLNTATSCCTIASHLAAKTAGVLRTEEFSTTLE